MDIHEVFSIVATVDGCLIIDMDYTGHKGDRTRAHFAYRASDVYAPMTLFISQWLADNIPEITPYVPVKLMPEELRAQMPNKTPREFRDILTDMGIFPQMVTEKINEIPFDVERQKALNSWDVMTAATRIDPYIDMIGAMFDKSPNEIDAAWLK
ncbi:MAG TPA: hypothetical protein VG519_13110 [Pseudochrobactrum sp.]|nr:hypothetical protein [Pseudochrobactrum sp.]